MKRILLATTFAALGTAAVADGHTTGTMGEGFDMLTAALMADFERMGIPTDVLDDLTVGQLAAIKATLEDGDESNDKGQIEAIIANN